MGKDQGKYQSGYVSLSQPTPAAGEIDRDAPLTVTWTELREALRQRFYPAVPAWDDEGQARIDRAADSVIAMLGFDPTAAQPMDARP